MFTTPVVIAIVVAATLGAAVGILIARRVYRPVIARLRADLTDVLWQLTHDPLTGLHNRNGLQAIHNVVAAYAGPRQAIAMLIDLDLFKEVNDAHGHAAGDDLLKVTARRIGQLAALYGGDAVRLSGDEFAVFMPISGTRLASMAEQFTTVIAEPVDIYADSGPVTLAITASLGIAVASRADLLEGVALHHADTAMYHAKQQGGNRHVFHQPGMTMPGHPPRRGPRLRDRRRNQNGSGA